MVLQEKNIKKLDKKMVDELIQRFNKLNFDYENWLNFFTDCRKVFLENYAIFFDDFLSNILADFDIDKRVSVLQSQNSKKYAQKLKNIIIKKT